MVAVIKTGSSIRRTVNYNEQKVKEGVAECIMAVNYPKDVEDLTLDNKLNRLLKQAALNENVARMSVHISLNFDPSEKLSHSRLGEIAQSYMQKIGFGKQPYLVYQHHDAGHPHIHIATIKVRADGSRIDMQNIGRNQSEKARKEIEHSFGLKRAEDSKLTQVYQLKAVNVQRVQYGKSETKRAITNVLNVVLNTYKYTSLAELNAVLRQYNVIADRGNETSRVYRNNGLTYRVIDSNGNKIGVPIKASDFYSKPTLSFLEQKFKENDVLRQQHKRSLKTKIDWVLFKGQKDLDTFKNQLQKEGIHVAVRQNDQGIIYGITYVDHINKTVFNGSDIGKEYSAKAMLEKLSMPAQSQSLKQVEKPEVKLDQTEGKSVTGELKKMIGNAITDLLQPNRQGDYLPNELQKKKKKKQSRRL